MTRFARSRGSKASNEKTPEDGTPWETMKEQLVNAKKESEESKRRQEAEKQRIENYENFLKERKTQKRSSTWCDFPETGRNPKKEDDNAATPTKKKKKTKQKQVANIDSNENVEFKMISNVIENNPPEKKNKRKKNKNKLKVEESPELQAELNNMENQIISEQQLKKKKKNKKRKLNSELGFTPSAVNSTTEVSTCVINEEENNFPNKQNKTDKKRKNKKKVKPNSDSTSDNTKDIGTVDENKNSVINKQNKIKALKNKKNKNSVDGKPIRKKAIDDRSFQLIINGKEVELTRYDSFPIMKKDAERLDELKDSMLKKGIPKSEVQRTLKLERRRAEKALARLKREVCYNCRKGGHNLSDCPELKSKIPGADVADGVCFKCGSTEHRQNECKVQRDKEFRFATCFICREPGHIARQCPDNPKGLYPNGGNCKLCGDVTHLRKDCPTVTEKKQDSSVKLQTLDSAENIEDIGQQVTVSGNEKTSKPKKIKFLK